MVRALYTAEDALQSRWLLAERVSRLEREAQTLKRIGEDISRIQQRIDDDASQRYPLSPTRHQILISRLSSVMCRDADLVCVRNELKEATSA